MERTRLAGTAKEAVLLALQGHQDHIPVRELLDAIARKGIATSVPAVYRALAHLELAGFVSEADPEDRQRAIQEFSRRRPPGAQERTLLGYRLTEKGVAMAALLKLGRSGGELSARRWVKATHLLFAALAGPDAACAADGGVARVRPPG